jgi:hypothetical protein
MQNNGRLPGYWLCFSPDTPQEKAAARFREKYGYPPREIILQRGLLWVGPVGEPEPRPASVIRRAEAAQRPLSPARALQLALQLEVTDEHWIGHRL